MNQQATTSPDLQRALDSLNGLSVGDGFGSRFFGPVDVADDAAQRRLPPGPWRVTDDTWMALSIFESLRRHGCINQDDLARSFGAHYEMSRGYGPAMHRLLDRIRAEKQWRAPAQQQFYGQGSFGNGGAMRVGPLGAFWAGADLPHVVEEARRSCEVTHTHPEGIAGAIGIAVAAALAHRVKNQPVSPTEFVTEVLTHTPDSEVASGMRQSLELDAATEPEHVAAMLGSGSRISAQDTVPFCVWMAAHNLTDYEAAMWRTLRGLGDVDTTCAIVGGIVATHLGTAGIPAEWLSRREALPTWAFTG